MNAVSDQRITNMSSGEKKGKLQNVIILRSFAIIAVVLYHCFCPWLFSWNWLDSPLRPTYSLFLEGIIVGRMPLFVCVSGFLFSYLFRERGKYQDFLGFFKNKIKRLLLPCVLFSVIISCTLQNHIIYDLFYKDYHLWFLKMLFICFMLTWVVGKYVKRKYQIVAWGVSLSLMALPDLEFFSVGQFFKYYVFFYTGFLFCKYRSEMAKYLDNRNALIVHTAVFLSACMALAVVYHNNQELAMGDIIHKSKDVVLIRHFLRFYTLVWGFSVVNNILSMNGGKCHPLFTKLNDLSYGIYLLHVYILYTIHFYLFDFFTYFSDVMRGGAPFLLFLFVFGLSVIATYLFKKTRVGKYLL